MLIVDVVLEYLGKTYNFSKEFNDIDGNEYPLESAEFMFEEGNYSCDCNKSRFIKRHCDKEFPEMNCTDKIKLISVKRIKNGI